MDAASLVLSTSLSLGTFSLPAPSSAPADPPSESPEPSIAPGFDPAGTEHPPIFGAKGTRRIEFRAGIGRNINNHDEIMRLGGIGLAHYIADGLGLVLELDFIDWEQTGEDAQSVDGALLFRWQIFRARRWSFYVEGGAGIHYGADPVPSNGSRFNFNPQAGIGFSHELAESTRLLVGMRWYHVSNARIYESNPGRDNLMVYAGLSFDY